MAELSRQAPAGIVLALVGNKSDLATEQRQVSAADGEALAAEYGALWAEVSAKTGAGIEAVFRSIGLSLLCCCLSYLQSDLGDMMIAEKLPLDQAPKRAVPATGAVRVDGADGNNRRTSDMCAC